jgi:RIO kinase 1
VRNSRRARAMEKGSKFGRQQQEEIWQTTEVDALKLLASAGVRVPVPYSCVDGVLLMEMIVDADGDVAPRLSEVVFTRDEALRDHEVMMQYVVKMLCAGVVHGDLSEFNVLVDPGGPVIIDLPQVVDAAGNNHAEAMLARDVNNISGYYGLYAPELLETKYAKEMWALFEAGDLEPETQLTGLFAETDEAADVDAVMAEIDAVRMEELERLERVREAEDELDG